MDDKLQIPASVELTKEEGWTQRDKYLYFIARHHLHIEEEQTDELGFGDILRTFHTTDFSETEVVQGFEEEFTIADVRETTRSILLENELNEKVTGTITGSAKSPLYELSANIETSLEQIIRSSVGQSIKSGHSVSTRVKKSFTISQKIKSGSQELHVAVAGYRKYSRNVFLHYIDYLSVEYLRTALGLRRKKSNLPRPIGGKHANRIPMNMPLFKLYYWKLESESSLLYTETEYRQLPKVKHPDRIIFEELREEISLPLPSKPDRPSLYTLSNIAFPLRWIDRKGPWTREELEKIELDEADGSAWWFQYGPGKDKT